MYGLDNHFSHFYPQEYFGFIKAMNIAVRGKSLQHQCHVSPITEGIIKLLESLDVNLTETPPIDQPQRFGNKAFKIWYEKLQEVVILQFSKLNTGNNNNANDAISFILSRALKIYSKKIYQKNTIKQLSK